MVKATARETNVSAEFPFALQYLDIADSKTNYIDIDQSTKRSRPVLLFFYGNTSSNYVRTNRTSDALPQTPFYGPVCKAETHLLHVHAPLHVPFGFHQCCDTW